MATDNALPRTTRTAKQKPSESPALALFFADPDIARLLRNSERHLCGHRDELTTISVPTLDQDGIYALRATVASIFPGQDVVARFRAVKVQALRTHLAAGAGDLRLSVDDLVYFQLALILMRLASDYLSAYDLFDGHREGFTRAYPRVLAFNPLTNTVSWDTVQRHMKEILVEGFRQRYDDMAITESPHFRDCRLANEALMIGMMVIDGRESKSESPDGLAFESECEAALLGAGFAVERTPLSGDFGVDLLARKNRLTYAVQCKCHSTPVGVSAIQEAAAGRLHYTADCAVVVARSGFTNQARRLAESNAVLLIGPPQLAELEHLSRTLL